MAYASDISIEMTDTAGQSMLDSSVGDWPGLLFDLMVFLIQDFQGKPKELATQQIAHRLVISRNPAARLWGMEIGLFLQNNGAVLSDSHPAIQAQFAIFFTQFVRNLVNQGIPEHRALEIAHFAYTHQAQHGAPLEPELDQPGQSNLTMIGNLKLSQQWWSALHTSEITQPYEHQVIPHANKLFWQGVTWEMLQHVRYQPKEPCAPGYHYDFDSETCVLDPTDQTCKPGYHWDSGAWACVPDAKIEGCLPGFHRQPFAGFCWPNHVQPLCDASQHFDKEIEWCVSDKPREPCPPGFYWEITYGRCVPLLMPTQCPPGFHWDPEYQTCMRGAPTTPQCPDGQHWDGEKCVPDSTPNNKQCCEEINASLGNIASAVTDSIGPQIGVPLASIVSMLAAVLQSLDASALAAIAPAISALEQCVCPTLDRLVSATQKISEGMDPPPPGFWDAIMQRGGVDPQVGQMVTGWPFQEILVALTSASKYLGGEAGQVESGLGKMLTNLIEPWAKSLIGYVEVEGETLLDRVMPYVNRFSPVISAAAKSILSEAGSLETDLPKLVFDAVTSIVTEGVEVTADTVEELGFKMYGLAFVVGQGIHLLASLAGYLGYPMSSIWSNNAKLLIDMLSFDKIIAAIHGSFFPAAIGEASRQRYARQFRPFIPSRGEGMQMFSRRKIDGAKLDEIAGLNGLHKDWMPALTELAYRPLQPFLLAQGFVNADVPKVPLRKAIENNGYNPADTNLAMEIVELRSLQTLRQAYSNEAVAAAGKGTIDLNEMDAILDEVHFGTEAKLLVRKRVLLQQRQAVAAATERAAIKELGAGEITAQQARSLMAAAQIADWQINTSVTLGETEAALKNALKAAAEEKKVAHETMIAANKTLTMEYLDGAIDEITLTAGLTLTLGAYLDEMAILGASPAEVAQERTLGLALIAAQVAQAHAMHDGKPMFAFGQILPRPSALLLHERVAAIQESVIRSDLSYQHARRELEALGISKEEAIALTDKWAAQIYPKGSDPLGKDQPKFS